MNQNREFVQDLQDVYNKHKKYLHPTKEGLFIKDLDSHVTLGCIEPQTTSDQPTTLIMATGIAL